MLGVKASSDTTDQPARNNQKTTSGQVSCQRSDRTSLSTTKERSIHPLALHGSSPQHPNNLWPTEGRKIRMSDSRGSDAITAIDDLSQPGPLLTGDMIDTDIAWTSNKPNCPVQGEVKLIYGPLRCSPLTVTDDGPPWVACKFICLMMGLITCGPTNMGPSGKWAFRNASAAHLKMEKNKDTGNCLAPSHRRGIGVSRVHLTQGGGRRLGRLDYRGTAKNAT